MKGADARRFLSSRRIGGPASIAVGLLVAGCAGQAERPAPTEVTRIPQNGGWFCQLAPDGDGWQCIQDPELAENPQPARIPEPTAPPEPPPAPLPDPAPTQPGRADLPPPDRETAPPPEPAEPPPAPAPTPGPTGGAASPERPAPAGETSASKPAYARLAYRPPEATSLIDLPRDFYALQVLAMSSREELESFVRRHGIRDVSGARVERDGKLYYVLLLGIYENRDAARRAAESLPEPFSGTEPWVRPLGSLQSAMRRAEALANATTATNL